MDLQNDWDVVKRGWDAQVLGEAPHKFTIRIYPIPCPYLSHTYPYLGKVKVMGTKYLFSVGHGIIAIFGP